MSGTLRHPLFRSAALPGVVAAGLLLLVLGIMVVTTGRSLVRMTPLQEHLAVIRRLQDQLLSMQRLAVQDLDARTPVSREMLAPVGRDVDALGMDPALLSAAGQRRVEQAGAVLGERNMPPHEALQRSIALLHEALAEEDKVQAALLTSAQEQARLERDLAAAALVCIPLASLMMLYLLRRRFLLPLRNLNVLLTRLGERDFAVAEVEDVDPVLAPLIANYNRMAERLARLESAQRQRESDLVTQVRTATRELMVQSRNLAAADRMAAIGEMAASLAHELRNPLAGVQMALANLKQELPQPDVQSRLDLVIAELRRVNNLMNSLLDQARPIDEAATHVDLRHVVTELLSLVRYQVDRGIHLESEIPEGLVCRLPENRLRQALLNLVLNAAQVLHGQGSIRLSAHRASGRLVIEVADDGPGFPDALLSQGPRHFASHRPGGYGLGLVSVRRLALDLGGELDLANPPGGGARVTLILPCPAMAAGEDDKGN